MTETVRYRELDVGFFWAALALATLGGFALGAFLVWRMAWSQNLPADLAVWIQVHGHLQLVGWAGLFIMGVSLFFLPRLAATPLTRPAWVSAILGGTVGGLLLETLARLVGPRLGSISFSVVLGLQALGAGLTAFGILSYVFVLVETFWPKRRKQNGAIRPVEPFLALVFVGWGTYAVVHGLLALAAVRDGTTLFPIAWHRWSVEAFMALTLFPVAYAFSVRTFPLYLQTPLPGPGLRRWGLGYAGVTAAGLLASMPAAVERLGTPGLLLTEALRLAWDGVVLGLLWDLNLFVRTRPSWLSPDAPLSPHPRTGQPPRRGYSDYGEFGRFEWLLYSAYAWLTAAVGLDAVGVVLGWTGRRVPYGRDPVRHAFLLGFITLLILGMAQRMLPGFMHRKRLAHPGIVAWTALLGNLSVLGRVGSLLGPAAPWPPVRTLQNVGLALSGLLALGAVLLLGWNLAATRYGRSSE
ncbi:hypothetical protein HRbin11_02077 [bacterium HR11]|nr:hypothetical protein HRbin11_02077 [bacterium HR11]